MSILEEPEEKRLVTSEICLRRCEFRSAYFREAVRYVNLERELERVTEQNELYKKAISLLLLEIKELLEPNYAALNLFKKRMSLIPEVTGVYYFIQNEVINIWTIIEKENFDVEMKIAESQCELLSIFQNLRFDFMVIPRCDRRLEDILPPNSMKITFT